MKKIIFRAGRCPAPHAYKLKMKIFILLKKFNY